MSTNSVALTAMLNFAGWTIGSFFSTTTSEHHLAAGMLLVVGLIKMLNKLNCFAFDYYQGVLKIDFKVFFLKNEIMFFGID